ncbi:MAG: hypothetical protein D6826_02825 [Alphaproteobacteria bacterium]|nr:MAG: hypothetical protein D6826_02825 [Alphaproteobacteria bacterium]
MSAAGGCRSAVMRVSHASRIGRNGYDVLRDHAWFIALALIYLVSGYVVARIYDQEIGLWLYNRINVMLYFGFASTILAVRIVWLLARHRPQRPLALIWHDLSRNMLSPQRLFNAAPAFVLLPLVLAMMTSLKRMIPMVQPFAWDPVLAQIDRFVHGGHQPWELLQPFLGSPQITVAISYVYAIPWLTLVIFAQFWHTFTLERGRMQFLLTYLLCWILLGTLAATAFSSTGPAFYGQIYPGPNPYAPLMDYLNAVAAEYRLPSALGQQYLWNAYVEDYLHEGSGISAMPSMHISMAFLFVLACWRRHRLLRWISVAFLIVMLIGSVHLAWHYAIDGYVSILGTGAIWWLVGLILRWRERRHGGTAAVPRTSEGAFT